MKRASVLPRAYSQDEEASAVVVIVGQAPPPLEDIISGVSTEKPFDMESLMTFAERRLFSEGIVFLTEVDALRTENDVRKYGEDLRHIVAEYVRPGASRQVNLSDRIRHLTEKHTAAVLDALAQDPLGEPDRTSLDVAYKAIFSLIRDDQYWRYTDYISVQRQLRVSKQEALWWTQEGLTAREFFTFPSPIDAVESRLHACLCFFLVAIAASLTWSVNFPWMWLYVTYGFLARFSCGPRLDPQAFLVLFYLRPLLEEKTELLKNGFVPGPPRRFAQFCGLMFSVVGTAAAFLEQRVVMLVVASTLILLKLVWVLREVCVACNLYMALARAQLIPASFCSDCHIRYIKGKGLPVSVKASTRPLPKCRFHSASGDAACGKFGPQSLPNHLLPSNSTASSTTSSITSGGVLRRSLLRKEVQTPTQNSLTVWFASSSDSRSSDKTPVQATGMKSLSARLSRMSSRDKIVIAPIASGIGPRNCESRRAVAEIYNHRQGISTIVLPLHSKTGQGSAPASDIRRSSGTLSSRATPDRGADPAAGVRVEEVPDGKDTSTAETLSVVDDGMFSGDEAV